MLYVIEGNPYHFYKTATTLRTPKHQRAFFQITLESLFDIDHRPLEDVPIQLYVNFFLPYENLRKDRSIYLHGCRMPPIVPMADYISKCLKGLAYVHEYQVASLIVNKIYDKKPRTELRISELTE